MQNQQVHLSVRYVVFALVALLFGAGIVVVSLQSPNVTLSPQVANLSLYRQGFSLFSKITPRHPLYTLLAVRDRIHLITRTTSRDRVYTYVSYANVRLGYAEELYKEKDYQLAAATLAKAEMYLARAAEELRRMANTKELQQSDLVLVVKALREHQQHMSVLKQHIPDQEKTAIDQLLSYSTSIQHTLSGLSLISF